MKVKPDLSFWKLWNISFGFFGVQIAYALQSANISRIFSTLGADPHNLSYFWILPPLAGIIVQPIVGAASDKTWTRFGRRIPYLFIGSLVAVLVMCLLPNAGSFGMAVSTAMIFGLVSLMFLDTSINMAMQPFKMMVGDMVNEKQKGLAYSIQSFLCNAGSKTVIWFWYHFDERYPTRQPGGISLPVHLCMDWHQQYSSPRSNPRLGDLLILHRSGHPYLLRHLHFGQSKRDATCRICRVSRHHRRRGT